MPSYFGPYFGPYFGYFPSTDVIPDENIGGNEGSSTPVSRPFDSGQQPVDANDCVEFELLDLPDPTPIELKCLAGTVVPPPPPPYIGSVSFTIKEEGPAKQFMIGTNQYTYSGSENWILGYGGFKVDAAPGEKVFMRIRFSLVVPGVGRNASGNPNDHGNFTSPSVIAGYLEILLGSRNGSKNYAPKGTLAHLPANSAYLRIPGVWHGSSAPVTINSWIPFSAECCLTNSMAGHPETCQSPMADAVGWSTDYDIFRGSTIKLVMEQISIG